MPKLTMSIKDRQGMFTTGLNRRLHALVDAETAAREQAAKTATLVTRAAFKRERQVIGRRPGRSSTGGHMQDHLEWTPAAPGVRFNIAKANQEAPHWIIQEIGTGQKGIIRQANRPNPVGRPTAGSTYVRTVRSQRGRRISGGLVFATGGQWSPPGSRRDEQLHWASTVNGVPKWRGRRGHQYTSGQRPGGQAAAIRIRNEIRGQHFVQKGGEAGFREYQTSVLAAARQAFRKSQLP